MDEINFKGSSGVGNDDAAFASMDDVGLTKRQYAAMMLRVPDSGLPWLDAMITKARELDIQHAMNIHGAMMKLTTEGVGDLSRALDREWDKRGAR